MADLPVKLTQVDEPGFQAYQRVFTQHIRNPKNHPRPGNVPAKRMAIYTEIVYNNIESTLAACFPVTKKILSQRKWQQLVRSFMADYRASTPIFREIPQQFLYHLELAGTSSLKLPAFLPSLMHYEWVELALSVVDITISAGVPQDVLREKIMLNPALYLLQYEYPVHQISADFQPTKPAKTPTHLLVFRNITHQIQFMELNPITFQLVSILQNANFTDTQITGEEALQKLAAENPQIAVEIVLQFGAQTLEELSGNGVILGTKKAQ